jgi:hypothetical protein
MIMGIQELPQRPFVCMAADFQQLNPVGGGTITRRGCESMRQIELETIYRSTDIDHLVFLARLRDAQPLKSEVRAFFRYRHWETTLLEAVRKGMQMQREHKKVFMWLCVTNKGAAEVNQAAVKTLGITAQDLLTGCASDPKVDGEFMCIKWWCA